ncbi:MAG: helix-turn-helix domain-containing protein [Oligoflexus sp.]|nr:helix-turn-helix domain-containing protein [Oligoflexus sp.]
MADFMHAAHRIEIDPNNKQKTYFARASGTVRFAYNWALKKWKAEYDEGSPILNEAFVGFMSAMERTRQAQRTFLGLPKARL